MLMPQTIDALHCVAISKRLILLTRQATLQGNCILVHSSRVLNCWHHARGGLGQPVDLVRVNEMCSQETCGTVSADEHSLFGMIHFHCCSLCHLQVQENRGGVIEFNISTSDLYILFIRQRHKYYKEKHRSVSH
jgi:hypothetical protein